MPSGTMKSSIKRISSSEITAHAECPQKWIYKYRDKRVARRESRPLEVGTVFHKLQETQALREKSKEPFLTETDAVDLVWSLYQGENEKIRADLRNLARWSAQWWEQAPKPWDEIVAAELEIEGRAGADAYHWHGPHLVGKIDLLVRKEGKLQIIDWKTTSKKGQALGPYYRWYSMSLPAMLYWVLAEKKYGEVSGAAIITFSKLAGKDKTGRERTWEDVVEILPYRIERERAEGLIQRAVKHYNGSSRLALSPLQRGRLTGACMGSHGNSLCEYVDVCQNSLSIQDELMFMHQDPYARYEEGDDDATG